MQSLRIAPGRYSRATGAAGGKRGRARAPGQGAPRPRYHRGMARKRRPAARRPVRNAPRRGATTGTPRPRRRPAWSLGRVRPRLARLPRLAWAMIGLVVFLCVNYAVQVARKPTELLGLVFSPAPLTPAETWSRYAGEARERATDVVRPELLAALIQVESSGDPLARTYWRWTWTWDPFRMYAPASSAVGLLQMTDANYEVAHHYCIRDHRVARDDGPVTDRCWFTWLYFRTVPSHSIEMTSAWLHLAVQESLPARLEATAGQ